MAFMRQLFDDIHQFRVGIARALSLWDLVYAAVDDEEDMLADPGYEPS
jgi:CHAD domain-containing protein